jgi:hypothetical protein
MRTFLRLATAFCADRLTLQERWLVLAFLGISILGSLVKYARTRPESPPSSPPSFHPSPTLSIKDPS